MRSLSRISIVIFSLLLVPRAGVEAAWRKVRVGSVPHEIVAGVYDRFRMGPALFLCDGAGYCRKFWKEPWPWIQGDSCKVPGIASDVFAFYGRADSVKRAYIGFRNNPQIVEVDIKRNIYEELVFPPLPRDMQTQKGRTGKIQGALRKDGFYVSRPDLDSILNCNLTNNEWKCRPIIPHGGLFGIGSIGQDALLFGDKFFARKTRGADAKWRVAPHEFTFTKILKAPHNSRDFLIMGESLTKIRVDFDSSVKELAQFGPKRGYMSFVIASRAFGFPPWVYATSAEGKLYEIYQDGEVVKTVDTPKRKTYNFKKKSEEWFAREIDIFDGRAYRVVAAESQANNIYVMEAPKFSKDLSPTTIWELTYFPQVYRIAVGSLPKIPSPEWNPKVAMAILKRELPKHGHLEIVAKNKADFIVQVSYVPGNPANLWLKAMDKSGIEKHGLGLKVNDLNAILRTLKKAASALAETWPQ